MLATLVAVFGTLAGAVVAGVLQQRAARDTADDTRAERRRTERMDAVTALAAALADHRRTMWLREDLRLSGAAPDRIAAARADSHATRSALTAPRTRLHLVLPDVAESAERAVLATFTLRDATDPATLAEYRDAALAAADVFTADASRHFA